MKTLILMRHSTAESFAPSDHDRALTAPGIELAKAAAAKLLEMGLKPDVILTSPLRRAAQTAKYIAEVTGGEVCPVNELNGHLHAQGLAQYLAAESQKADTVLAVGHNPNISLAAGVLVKTDFGFSPAEFAVLNMDNPHRPQLVYAGDRP